MSRVESGTLLLADIGGYTAYLTGVELEHSHDILADLISTVTEQTKGAFRLAKLEGDAIFCVAPDGGLDGSALITTIDSCYFTFSQRLRDIDANTTCDCGACRLVPSLTLKFVAHHGRYVTHEIAGNPELVGSDVILVHRLLKNDVVEKTGAEAYAYLTAACLERFSVDATALGMSALPQIYEDVGEVNGFVLDMQKRWDEEQTRRRVYVEQDDAFVSTTLTFDVPPAVLWDVLSSPKRLEWMKEITRFDQNNPGGVRGVGTTNHCVHGKTLTVEQVLDWKPYRYFTIRSTIRRIGSLLFTWELTSLDGGSRTQLDVRVAIETPGVRGTLLKLARKKMKNQLERMGVQISEYATAEGSHARTATELAPR